MKKTAIILLLISQLAFSQSELLPVIDWRTYVDNVEQLTDSTYKFSVMPLDWNEPGAATMQYGNYFQDYTGNTYQVIDSAYLSVTVWDVFNFGVSPQVGRIGKMYLSVGDGAAPYIAPIDYRYLDESALDNARARELAVLWRQANLYAKDSSHLVWWNDTIQNIATKYDIDTLNQKTLDSILIHRTEIDELKNTSIELDFATLQEALIGTDSTKIISPLTNKQVDSLVNVPYSGALENIYSEYNITVDTLISTSLQGTSIRAVAVDEDGRLIDTTFVFDDIELLRDSVIDNINRIYELSDSVIYLYGWNINQSDSIENNYIWDFQQSDSIQFLYEWLNNVNFQDSVLTYQIFQDLTGIRDTLQFHSDSLAIAFDSISKHNSRLIELKGLDTTGIFHHNRQFLDSLSYATLQDVLIGVDTSKIITPFIAAQRDSLLNVPYSGAIENIYTDYNFTADSIFANYFNIDFDSLHITVSQITDLPIQVKNETPTGTINGTNDTFSTAYNFKSETTEVYLNGVLQVLNVDYTEGSGQIIFNAGFEPYTGDYLTINYIR